MVDPAFGIRVDDRVGALALPDPVLVEPDMALGALATVMADAHVGVVVLRGDPVGIITEHDLVTALACGGDYVARDIASLNPGTIGPEASVLDAARAMACRCVCHMVVADAEGTPVMVIPAGLVLAVLVHDRGPDRTGGPVHLFCLDDPPSSPAGQTTSH